MAISKQEKVYNELCKQLKIAATYSSTQKLLEWDQETYMPEKGIELKIEQSKLLLELSHKLKTNTRLKTLLSSLIDFASGAILVEGFSEAQKANIREMKRDYEHHSKIPGSFIKKFSQTTTESLEAWKVAKKSDSFKTFAPHLKKIVSLLQKKAEYLGYKETPYDALIDEYEPGMTSKKYDQIFSPLKQKTLQLLKRWDEQNKKIDPKILEGDFPIEKQKMLCKEVIKDMGLANTTYNLSETHHPFCLGLYPNDIRLTTHFYKEAFMRGFGGVIHEAGHALYENGLPLATWGTPLSEPASYAVHESQSRIWETFIGHSYPFWKLYYTKVKQLFPGVFQDASIDDVYRAVNQIKRGLIRIHADEVTYNLHIILRYEIEKGLLEGTYDVKDLPDIWNQKMRETLGIVPKTNSEGCLQDIHWSLGFMGYFPSYTLGNIFAGQLYVSLMKTHTDWDKKIKEGDFLFIRDFLREKVHRFGRQYLPIELIERASGIPFSIDPYTSYLEGKYS